MTLMMDAEFLAHISDNLYPNVLIKPFLVWSGANQERRNYSYYHLLKAMNFNGIFKFYVYYIK